MKSIKILSVLCIALLFSACKEILNTNVQGNNEVDRASCPYDTLVNNITYQSYNSPQVNRNLSFMPISVFNDYASNLFRVELILDSGKKITGVTDSVFIRPDSCQQCNDDYLQLDFRYVDDTSVASDSMIVVTRSFSQEEFTKLEFIVVSLNGEKKKVVTTNSNVAPFFGKSKCGCED